MQMYTCVYLSKGRFRGDTSDSQKQKQKSHDSKRVENFWFCDEFPGAKAQAWPITDP